MEAALVSAVVAGPCGKAADVASAAREQTLPPVKADRVEVDKKRQTVKLIDKSNSLIGFFPATVGSEEKPSPFTIQPGPNNPVGTVWINLSADGYGIHGTPSPGDVSKAQSHGCVRLTNRDAERVADAVAKGTKVTFVDDAR